jgi:hypothetical protein
MTAPVHLRFGGPQPPTEVIRLTHTKGALCVEAGAPLVAEPRHTFGELVSYCV